MTVVSGRAGIGGAGVDAVIDDGCCCCCCCSGGGGGGEV